MEYIKYIVFALIILLIVRRMMPAKGVKNITVAELKTELKDKNKEYIDVRTPGEFRRFHIPGFKNIPLNELSKKADSLSKEKEIIVICQSGMRSQNASRLLVKSGFTQVTNVTGGISAWR